MKKILLGLLFLLPSLTVSADSWIYGGASIGSSTMKDQTSLAHSFYIGSGIMPWVGIEGGFTEHGKFDLYGGEISADSVYGALKPNLNFGPLQLYAKVGVHSWLYSGEEDVTVKDDDGLDMMWAVGADFSLASPIAIGIEYVTYTVADTELSSVNATATLYLF